MELIEKEPLCQPFPVIRKSGFFHILGIVNGKPPDFLAIKGINQPSCLASGGDGSVGILLENQLFLYGGEILTIKTEPGEGVLVGEGDRVCFAIFHGHGRKREKLLILIQAAYAEAIV